MKGEERVKGSPDKRPGARRGRSLEARSADGASLGHADSASAQPEKQSLGRMLETLKPHDHLCLIYETPQEWQDAIIPFVKIGLERGEKCCYFADTHTAEQLRGYLQTEGVDVASAEASGRLVIFSESEAYTKEGSFDPDLMISLLVTETEKTIAEGYPALRLTGEMTWVLHGLPGSERLLEYEAKLNRDFYPKYPALGICQYDRWKFDPETIKGIVMTHPLLVRGSYIYSNFYYIPTDEFLNTKRAEIEAQHWLNNLERERIRKQELLESEERFRRIIENAPFGYYRVGKDGLWQYVNPVWERMHGFSYEEIVGKPFEITQPEDAVEQAREYVRRCLAGETITGESSRLRKDGNIEWHSFNIQPVYYGSEIVAIEGFIDDITGRKKTEDELRLSEARYRTLFESAAEGILITDIETKKFRYANPAICIMLGYSQKELVKMGISDIHPKTALKHVLAEFSPQARGEQVLSSSIPCLKKDGTIIYTDVKGARAIIDGRACGIGFFTDVTERKQVQTELQKIERLDSIGILAGGIAHDFNNLLTAIMGNIGLAKRYMKPQGKAFERLDEAEAAALRAGDLTHQLLTFSKGGAPIKKIAAISELVKEAATFALRGSNVRLELSLPKDLWAVEVDEGQMSHVIQNIVINADQAMPDGGTIHISARNTAVQRLGVLSLPKGNYVQIDIRDEGIGMSESQLARLFEPYYTTKQKGSGLGLATAYSIINNHGGHIDAESTQDVGTTFHIYLPASSKPALKKKKLTRGKPVRGKGRILIMDDEEIIRAVLLKMLTLAGYNVESAKDGAEAVELYKKARESGRPFDAVVLDLTVPGGMGGKEAVKKMLEIDPKVKAIVSSGYATDPIMSGYKKYGFSAVVTKPYTVMQMEETLYNVLEDE